MTQAEGVPRERRRHGVGPMHHIALSVRDLEASTEFYSGFLGLRQTLRTESSGEAFENALAIARGSRAKVRYFEGGELIGQIELLEWQDRESKSHKDNSPYDICVLAFSVTDEQLDELVKQAPGRGYDLVSEIQSMVLPNYGPIRNVLIVDPDGRRVELVALPSTETIREYRQKATRD